MNNFKKNKLVGTWLSTLGRGISAAYADVVFPKPVKEFLVGFNKHEEDKGNLLDTAGAKALNETLYFYQ